MRNEAGWMKPDFRFKTIKQNATQSQIYQSTGRKMNLIFTRNSPELLFFDLENHFQKSIVRDTPGTNYSRVHGSR